ncbi:sugar-binding domain-containing protein, partial [Bifidobacterium bifidum]
ALEGVGATEGDRLSPVFDAYVTPHMVKEIRAQGAVATVCGHFIDAQGRPVCSELSDRIISVELDRLKRIALVIGVAWGQEKVKAIKACLVGGYISALATDQATAESLLA